MTASFNPTVEEKNPGDQSTAPSRSASARDTGDEVVDSDSLSFCPQYSIRHMSEESPAPHEYDQPAHSIVGQAHLDGGVGSEVHAPEQTS